MILFDLWGEALIFAIVYGFLIIVPCCLIVVMGNRLIKQLGQYPSKTPEILMSSCLPFIILEVCTFAFMLLFYNFFRAG